ncbi:MAG: alpha/beta hydrolase [Chloroflexi bacterium]|nr:alpha/beta hydrolase [Chloroflexota bacterium]MYD16223.1 alpha/beta hydrolase [Chloroflexota bacterium]MYJ01123.1 alpha/beta hydrolase [Chloroflexota bacterium]
MTSALTANVNGLDLCYLDHGGDAAVSAVALHGFALNCHSFDEVAPALSDRLHWYALDQRGHGRSDRAAELSDYSRDHMAADIGGFIEALGLERPVVLGHSMGGMNAMTFAARHPEQLRALVLIDVGPGVSVDGVQQVRQFVQGPYEMDSLDAWVDMTHQYYPFRSKEGIRKRLEVSLRETPEGKMAKMFDERFREADFRGVADGRDGIWETANALTMPTLLLHGENSPVLKREQAEEFADRVEVVRLVTIPDAGHSVAGDQPEAFTEAVRDFLSDVL